MSVDIVMRDAISADLDGGGVVGALAPTIGTPSALLPIVDNRLPFSGETKWRLRMIAS